MIDVIVVAVSHFDLLCKSSGRNSSQTKDNRWPLRRSSVLSFSHFFLSLFLSILFSSTLSPQLTNQVGGAGLITDYRPWTGSIGVQDYQSQDRTQLHTESRFHKRVLRDITERQNDFQYLGEWIVSTSKDFEINKVSGNLQRHRGKYFPVWNRKLGPDTYIKSTQDGYPARLFRLVSTVKARQQQRLFYRAKCL